MNLPLSSQYSDNYLQYQVFQLSIKFKEQRTGPLCTQNVYCSIPHVKFRNLKKRNHVKRILKQHFLGYYPFKSKTQDEFSPEGWCKAAMYALLVKEELGSWPEKNHRQRSWLTIPKAIECCRHAWMREALEKGFWNWYAEGMICTLPIKDVPKSSSNQR